MSDNVVDNVRSGLLLDDIMPEEIVHKRELGESFVVNIVTSWCPDCTVRQAQFIEGFASRLQAHGLHAFQCVVQHERTVFVTDEHKKLTENCGGHGYPRTVLFFKGQLVDWENVEIVTAQGLEELVVQFLKKISSAQ